MNSELASPLAQASAAPPGGNGKGEGKPAGERLYSTLLKHLPGAVYRCRNDAEWTVEFISDGCLTVTGYRADELTGNRVVSLGAIIHPADAAPVWERSRAELAAHRACSSEYRIRHRGGEERWVWDQAQGIYSDAGELLFIEGLLTDITAQKAAETQALTFAALGRQLNGAASAREAGEIVLDAAQRMFGWDAATVDLYHAAADTVESVLNRDTLGGRRLDFAPTVPGGAPSPRGRKVLREGAQLILREPPFAFGDGDVPTGDKGRPSATIMAVPVRQGASVVGLLSIQSYTPQAYTRADLDTLQALADYCGGAFHRLQTREALRASEERLRLSVQASNIGLWDWDVGTNQVAYSREWKSQLGYTEDEIGNAFAEWERRVHPDDLVPTLERVRRALAAGEAAYEVEFRMRHKDGAWRWIYARAEIFRDDRGQAVRVMGCHVDITERKQADENLRASEERLRLATQAAGIGAFEWDTQTGVNVWTPKLEAMHGLKPGEFRGTQGAWEQLLHPEDRAQAVALVQQAIETFSPQEGEWRVVWPDGSVHWLAGRFQAFRDGTGSLLRLIGVNYDITTSKQAEVARWVAEAKYHSIFQHAVEGIYQSTPDGHYLTVNPAMARIYGYASAEEMLQEITDIGRQLYVDPEDRRRLQAQLRAQSGAGVFECQMRRKDGALIWIRQSIRVVWDGRGGVLCYEGSVEDITERRLAEERLRHQHALLTAVVEGASDAVFLKDLAGRYQLINAAGARAMGRPVEEIIGRTDAELVPPETASRFRAVDEAVVATGTTQVQEESGFMAGKLSHWHANKAPWRDADGRIQGVIGVSRDITERRQAEAARREAEVRFQTLFERAPVGVVILDPTTARVLECNEQAARQLGYTIEEFTGLAIPDFEAMETDTQTRERIAQILRAGRDTFETRHRTRSGELRDVLVTTQIIELAGRAVLHCIFLDITESRQTKKLLALRARQQAVVADLGLLALAATELPPLFDQTVARVAETFGVEFCKVLELLPEGNAVKLVAGVGWKAGLVGHATVGVGRDSQAGHTLLAKEPVIVEDLRTETRFNGPPLLREHGVVSGLSVIIGSAAHPIGVLGVHSARRREFTPDDVSFLQAVANVLAEAIRRHRVEQARRDSEAALNRAQAVAHIGSWRLDVTRNILTWSAESHRIFGIPEGTPLTYESFLACVHPEDRTMVDRAWQASLRGAPYDIEHRIIVGEQTRWVRERASLEFDAGGRLLRGVGTAQDITERAWAEAEIVQLSGRLLRAQDEERRRLARELHDSTAQTFAALAMNLAVLGRSTPGLDAAGRALLAECDAQVRRGTAELRTLAYLLHPPALEALGLARAIHDYAEGFARRSGVRVELDVAEPPDRLPPETELALFRVLQESLGNIHRHSGSTSAVIRLAQDAETVVIEVRDMGRGLAAAELAAATSGSARFGVGIAGMRERLRLLGGRLEIEPALPGVRVRATLPLSTTANE